MNHLSTPNRSLVERFAVGASGSLIAAVIGQALPLLVGAILARLLPTTSYGAFLFYYGTAATFASLTGYSIGLTATRYVALFKISEPRRAGIVIVRLTRVTISTSVAIAILGALLTRISLLHPIDVGGFRSIVATALLFVALALAGVQAGILSGLQRFAEVARGNFARMLVGLPLTVCGGWRFSVAGSLIALAIATLVGCVLNHVQIRRACQKDGIPLDWGSRATETGMWMQFSVPSFLAYSLVAPVIWFGQTLLLSTPNGLHEVAAFNIAQHWRNVIVFVPAAMIQAATPLMTELFGAGDEHRTNRVLYFNIAVSGLVALGCASLVILFGDLILSAYGPAFTAIRPLLIVAGGAAVLATINNALGSMIVAAGRMWVGLLFNFLWASSLIASAVPLSQRMGALGLSLSVLFAYVLHTLWQSAYVLRIRLSASNVATTPVPVTANAD